MKRLKIGYVGMIQKNFTGDKAGVRKRSLEDLTALVAEMGCDLFVYPDEVVLPEDANKAKAAIEAENVDFVLLQNTSFCSGYLVQILAKTNAAIGLWAVPETTESGPMPLNSFCGINIGSALIKHYLKEYKIKYKWFYGYGDDPMFTQRLKVAIRALRALVNLRDSKVGFLGGIAPGFDNFYDDERLVEKRFGITIDRHLEFNDIASRSKLYKSEELKPVLAALTADTACITDRAIQDLEKFARVYLAYRDIAKERGLSAFASTCWPRFRLEMSTVPCLTFARLTDAGIVTACEGDVLSAISMLALKYIADDTPTHMDLSIIDNKDDSMLFWHCGVGSKFYAKGDKISVEQHFNPGPYSPETGWAIQAPVSSMEFAPANVSIMRFTNECGAAFVMGGDFFDGKLSHDGSRGWMHNFTFNGEAINVPDLVNTILVNGFHHHYPMVRGNYFAEIMDLLYFLDIKLLKRHEYAHFNRPETEV